MSDPYEFETVGSAVSFLLSVIRSGESLSDTASATVERSVSTLLTDLNDRIEELKAMNLRQRDHVITQDRLLEEFVEKVKSWGPEDIGMTPVSLDTSSDGWYLDPDPGDVSVALWRMGDE